VPVSNATVKVTPLDKRAISLLNKMDAVSETPFFSPFNHVTRLAVQDSVIAVDLLSRDLPFESSLGNQYS
jgi:hypothetical protein